MKTGKHSLAQQFKETDRFNLSVENQLTIQNDSIPTFERSEFARDRDRILFSRAFRRLQHKAQVFSNETGDHYRTRLTHTLEVSQISRSLAINLQADEYLAEAIAVGHDIGHTPFGHQGERVLDEIMMGKDNLGTIKYHFDFGGFKHNFNSLRVLDVGQLKFDNCDGLNLSWQVLEGILKHTKTKRTGADKSKVKSWDIKNFISHSSLEERFYLEYNHSVTLEGQIVAIADEIAQRQHDIDDGLRNEKLKMDIDVVYSDILKICQEIVDNSEVKSQQHLTEELKSLSNLKEKLSRNLKSSNRLFKNDSLIRDIIEYFIIDVSNNTFYSIQAGIELTDDNDRKILKVDKKVVDFSPIGHEFNDRLETLVKNRILNSYEINKFDGKSSFIIRQLFKAYYTNPLQMPSYALYRLQKELIQNAKTCKIKLLLENEKTADMENIDFKTMNRAKVKALLNSLKLKELSNNIEIPDGLEDLFQESDIKDGIYTKFDQKLRDLNERKVDDFKEAAFLKCILENHHMYLISICDYIAGMSDNYAKKEYKELYLVD